MRAEFRVLGPLEVRVDGVVVPVPAGRVRVLLATLLLRANRFVSVNELIDQLWDGAPPNPDRAKTTLQMVVTRLRRALGQGNCVRTTTGGYLAEVESSQLDLLRFRAMAEAGDLSSALALWRGPVLANVMSDALHRDDVPALEEERLIVLERRIDSDLARGRARELLIELRSLTERHPLRERFWGQLMLALYQSDQRAEALAVFTRVRELLAEELGIDPGPQLTEVHEQILRGEVVMPRVRDVPRQLPDHGRHFVGREHELSEMDRGEPLVVLHGTGGVGKTTLALRWASAVRDRYPDGDLYLDLRGFGPAAEPVDPASAAETLLLALAVRGEDVPMDQEARFALLRSTLADRRMLLVLDNAASSAQVVPLLPSAPGVTVLITSRNQLRGLSTRYAPHRIPLRQLGLAPARDLLGAVLGATRVSAEPEAVRAIVERCDGLPLALRVFAEKVARFPDSPLAEFAAELRDEQTRLDALTTDDGDDTDVRAVFSWSYRALDDDAARLFRMLPSHPGREWGAPATAVLAGMSLADARRLLERLVADHLLQSATPGRYHFHDLLRAYAAGLDGENIDAVRRVTAWYAHTAANACPLLTPGSEMGRFEPPSDVHPQVFEDRAAAAGWWRQEWDNLRATQRIALDHGWHRVAWLVPAALFDSLDYAQRLGPDTVELFEAVLDAGDEVDQARILSNLAWLYGFYNRVDDAIECYQRALVLIRGLGDRRRETAVAINLTTTYSVSRRFEEALDSARHAIALNEEVGDEFYRGAAFNNMAVVLTGLWRYEEAAERAKAALLVFERLGDDLFRGRVLYSLARAEVGLGRFESAVENGYTGLRFMRQVGVRFQEAELLENLGAALLCCDRRIEGLDCWRQSAAIFADFDADRAQLVRTWIADLDEQYEDDR